MTAWFEPFRAETLTGEQRDRRLPFTYLFRQRVGFAVRDIGRIGDDYVEPLSRPDGPEKRAQAQIDQILDAHLSCIIPGNI